MSEYQPRMLGIPRPKKASMPSFFNHFPIAIFASGLSGGALNRKISLPLDRPHRTSSAVQSPWTQTRQSRSDSHRSLSSGRLPLSTRFPHLRNSSMSMTRIPTFGPVNVPMVLMPDQSARYVAYFGSNPGAVASCPTSVPGTSPPPAPAWRGDVPGANPGSSAGKIQLSVPACGRL